MEEGSARVEKDLGRPGVRELFESSRNISPGLTNWMSRTFPSATRRAVFTAAPRRWRRRRSGTLARVISGGPGWPSATRTIRAISFGSSNVEAIRGDTIDSLSHTGDCVRACLDLWKIGAPFGIYNMTNPGAATTRHLAESMHRAGQLPRPLDFRGSGKSRRGRAAKRRNPIVSWMFPNFWPRASRCAAWRRLGRIASTKRARRRAPCKRRRVLLRQSPSVRL